MLRGAAALALLPRRDPVLVPGKNGGGAGNEVKPWAILISTLLVGLAIGVGGTILLPSAIEPYLVSALRAPRRFVEGQVIGKQREQGHVLLKVQTEEALILATFTKKVPEIDLLVERGDSISLALANTGPFEIGRA